MIIRSFVSKKLNLTKNIEENTSTYPIASSAEGNLEKCIDQDLSTVFTTENKTAGWLEYKLTDNTKIKIVLYFARCTYYFRS